MVHNKKKIAAAAGFLLLFALAAGFLWFFSRPKSQILVGAYRTYRDSDWIPVLRQSDFLQKDDLSAEVDWRTGSVTGKLDLQFTGEETGIAFRTGMLGASVDIQGILSQDMLKLKIPLAGDVVYTHGLREETPFFDKLFGSRNAGSIDRVLTGLSGFRWKKAAGAGADAKAFAEGLKDVGVKKAEPENFEIDGETVSCRGYVLELSESALQKEAGISFDRAWVYLYRGRLAAVRVPAGESFFEVRFLGGEHRDEKLMFVRGEEFFVTVRGRQEGEDFPVSIVFENSEGTHISLRGRLEKDSLWAEIRSAEIRGRDCRLEGELSVVPGAQRTELAGDTMDLEHLSDAQKQILLAVFRLFRIS